MSGNVHFYWLYHLLLQQIETISYFIKPKMLHSSELSDQLRWYF